LYVVDLVDAAVKSELDIVLAVYLVEDGRQLPCVLAQAVITIGVSADVGISGRRVLVNKDRRNAVESIGLQIRRETQRPKRIIFAMRVVGISAPDSTSESQSRS